MPIQYAEDFWLHEHYEFSLAELAQLAGMSEPELREWVEEGVLVPLDPLAAPLRFGADRLAWLQRACRLRRDFELELQGLALVMELLERISALESEVRDLQAKMPGA